MSFGSTLNVGTLSAQFTLSAAPALATITSIQQEAATIKNAFGNVVMRLDASQATAAVKELSAATVAYKTAQTQATDALTLQRTALTGTKTALDQQKIATEAVRTANVGYVQSLTQQKLATEEARTATANARAEIAAMALNAKQAGAEMQALGTEAQATGGRFSTLGSTIQSVKGILEFTAALAAFQLLKSGIEGVIGSAANWQTTLAQLQGNTTLTTTNVKELDTAIRSLAATTPTGMDDLANAFRHVTNEGYGTADAIKIVTEANLSAIATGAKTSDVANTLAIVMHTFGIETQYAAQTMNVLHLAAATGNLTLEQFVESGGKVFSTAASVGLSITEVSAAYATLTKEGFNAAESSTILTGLIQKIIGPSAGATKELQALSKTSGIDLVSEFSAGGLAANGLAKVINDVAIATGGDTTEIFKLLPALRGGRGEMVLGGAGAKDYADSLNLLNDAWAGRTNPTLVAFNNISQTTNYQWGVAKNTLHLFALEIGNVLLPFLNQAIGKIIEFGDALGKVFGVPGLSTLKAGWDAQKKNLDDTNAALGQATQTVKDFNANPVDTTNNQAQLGAFKGTIDNASLALAGLSAELNINKQALDANAAAIQGVKNQYDPVIKQATDKIKDINLLTPDELARKNRELDLDKQRADLELKKPDVSSFDTRIFNDRQTLDNWTPLDTSSWDTKIAGIQKQIETAQDSDPAAGIKASIQSIQDEISNLNTDEFDRKIQAIRDRLSEPPPNTIGLSNAMTALEAQLSGGQISRSQFDTQYAALGKQKAGILDTYEAGKGADTSQLKILEQQRSDQALANKETAAADRKRIEDLKEQQKTIEATAKKEMADLRDKLKTEEDGRKKALADDAAAKKKVTDDEKQATAERALALKPYEDAVKRITDAQQHNADLDKAAAAQRAIDLAPWKQALDEATAARDKALAPLDTEKQRLDDIKTKLDEQKLAQEAKKSAAEGELAALKQMAPILSQISSDLGKTDKGVTTALTNLLNGGDPTANLLNRGEASGLAANAPPESPLVKSLKDLKAWIEENGPGLVTSFKTIFTDIADAVKVATTAIVDIAHLTVDMNKGDWGAVWSDLQRIGGQITSGSGAGGNGPGTVGYGTGIMLGGVSPYDAPPSPGASFPTRAAQSANPGAQEFQIGLPPFLAGSLFSDPAAFPFGPLIRAMGGPNVTKLIDDTIKGVFDHIRDTIAQNMKNPLASAGGAIDTALPVVGVIKDLWDAISGGSKVAAADLSEFDQTQNAILGTNGRLKTNVTDTGNTVATTMGAGGPVDSNLNTSSPVQQAIGSLGQTAGQWFGEDGALARWMRAGGPVPNAFQGVVTAATQNFGDGQGAQVPISQFGTFLTGQFGQSDSIVSRLLTGDVPNIFAGLVKVIEGQFNGDNGPVRNPFTAFGGFLKKLFGSELSGYVGALGPAIDAVMPSDLSPLQGFMTSVATAVRQIGKLFQIPELANFQAPDVSYHNAGAAAAQSVGSAVSGLIGHATGLLDNPLGHMAMVGERGPELMFVPKHASIVPNHLLPGHADGYNLSPLTLPGVFAPVATALFQDAQTGIQGLLGKFGSSRGRTTGRAGGTAFRGMDLAAFLAYMGNFPGSPLDTESAFNDLMSVGQEHNLDPRWFMAIIQTENGFGTAPNDRLPSVNNYGGMGINNRGFSFDSGIHATDGGPEYAGYASFRDFLEDEAGWIAENGTSFAGYQTADAGQGKNAAFAQILAAIPAIGGAVAGAAGASGQDDVLRDAMSYLGSTAFLDANGMTYCEGFVDTIRQDFGIARKGFGSAFAHAQAIMDQLRSGPASAGEEGFWVGPGWSTFGHTGIAVGDGTYISALGSGITHNSGNWEADAGYLGHAPIGLADGGISVGGAPRLVVVGDGPNGEREFHTPEPELRKIVRAESRGVGNVTVTLADGAIHVDRDGHATLDPTKVFLRATQAAGLNLRGM